MLSIIGSFDNIFKNKWTFSIAFLAIFWLSINATGQEIWTQINPRPTVETLNKVVFKNGKFVAVGTSGIILTSTDGNVWSQQLSGTTKNLNAVCWGNNQFIAVGNAGTILTSPDAIVWMYHQFDTTENYNAISFGGNKVIVAGSITHLDAYDFNRNRAIILSSLDDTTWTYRLNGIADSIYEIFSVSYGNSGFVALCNPYISDQSILFSSDGNSWTGQSRTLDFFNESGVWNVTWGKNQFIAVGIGSHCTVVYHTVSCSNTSSFLSSSDGTNWITPTTNSELRYITWCNDKFYGFPRDSSKIMTSSDGTTWTIANVSSLNTLHDVAWGADQYIVVGGNGVILTTSTTYHSGIFQKPNQARFNQNQLLQISGKTAHYFLPRASEISINLYTTQGRFVKNLYFGKQKSGAYSICIPSLLAQGRYIFALRAGHTVIDKAILITR